jgi:hypothetical protein
LSVRSPSYLSALLHVVGGAITLDQEAKITRLTAVWDGAMIPDVDIKTLIVLSLE